MQGLDGEKQTPKHLDLHLYRDMRQLLLSFLLIYSSKKPSTTTKFNQLFLLPPWTPP